MDGTGRPEVTVTVVSTPQPENESLTNLESFKGVDVYGYPGYRFYAVHVVAMVCMTLSLICASCLLVQTARSLKSLCQLPITVRLSCYLATCDVGFYGCHYWDHGYMVVKGQHLPGIQCAIVGSMLNQFGIAQTLVVVFTALNAFLLIVKERKLSWGKRDWKMLLAAFGIPASLSVIGLATGHFGPSGMMCYIDMSKSSGPLVANVVTLATLIAFLLSLFSYLCVWLKIKYVSRLAEKTRKTKNSDTYGRTAGLLALFVLAYITQWWAYIAFAIWDVFGSPHFAIRLCCVLFVNLGGAFNFLAYTYARRILTSSNAAKRRKKNRSADANVNHRTIDSDDHSISTIA